MIEEVNALRSRMQHAGMADAARCSDCCTALCRRSEQFRYSLPRNSVSRFHQIRCSFPSIQIPVSTDVVVPFHESGFSLSPIRSFLSTNSNSRFHEFRHSLPPIQTFLSTNVGKQKRHPFVGMSFSIAFPLSGGAWRIRTAVDGFADR